MVNRTETEACRAPRNEVSKPDGILPMKGARKPAAQHRSSGVWSVGRYERCKDSNDCNSSPGTAVVQGKRGENQANKGLEDGKCAASILRHFLSHTRWRLCSEASRATL